MQNAKVILSLLSQKAYNRPEFVFQRLYRYLFHPSMYTLVTKRVLQGSLSPDVYQDVIKQLRKEQYIVGENAKQDQIVAELLYTLLYTIYEPQCLSNRWKPQSTLHEAFSKIKKLQQCKEVLQVTIPFHQSIFPVVLKHRIADGRLIRLLARFLLEPCAFPKLFDLFQELWLIFIQQEMGSNDCQQLTPVFYQQQLFVFFPEGSRASSARLEKRMKDLFQIVKTKRYSFIGKQHERLLFHGFEIVRDYRFPHRLLLLIPHREVWKKLRPYLHDGKAVAMTKRMHFSVDEILRCYQQEAWDIKQMYQFADNHYHKLRLFSYYHRQSLIYTLAQKLKQSPRQVRKKYRRELKQL